MKFKTHAQSKQPLDKSQSSKFCQSGVKQSHFQNLKRKGSDFFLYHSITLKSRPKFSKQ